jgi:hypothetical protein
VAPTNINLLSDLSTSSFPFSSPWHPFNSLNILSISDVGRRVQSLPLLSSNFTQWTHNVKQPHHKINRHPNDARTIIHNQIELNHDFFLKLSQQSDFPTFSLTRTIVLSQRGRKADYSDFRRPGSFGFSRWLLFGSHFIRPRPLL